MNHEIERKFLLETLPEDLKYIQKARIKQGYLALEKDREVRLRQKEKTCYQTVKIGSGLRRKELETEISQSQFDLFWEATEGLRLEKIRYTTLWQEMEVEIDAYQGSLQGLYTAEVEFVDKKEAALFQPPPYFGEEVTFDKRYMNRSLARIDAHQLHQLLPSGMNKGVVGTIPYFWKKGKLRVILVTKRNNHHWIFPKGHQESRKTFEEVALLEAYEEAGVEGTVTHRPIRIPYKRGSDYINMLAFPIEVSKLRKQWDEREERLRKVVSLKEAFELSDQPAVHSCLKFLKELILE